MVSDGMIDPASPMCRRNLGSARPTGSIPPIPSTQLLVPQQSLIDSNAPASSNPCDSGYIHLACNDLPAHPSAPKINHQPPPSQE